MPGLLDVDKARKELDGKDLLTIERETAKTWGGRAAASYLGALEDPDHSEQMRFFWEAETYRAEAVEHAAMTEDADFVRDLTAEIESYRSKARAHLLQAGHAFVEGNRTPKAHRGARPMAAQPATAPPPAGRAQRLASRPAPAPSESPQAAPAQAQAAAPAHHAPKPNRSAQTTPGLGRRPGEGPPQ